MARLLWGTRKLGGRERGALDRFTRLREEFVDVYQNCEGRGRGWRKIQGSSLDFW